MAKGALSYFWQRKDDVIPTGALGKEDNILTLVHLIPPNAGQYRCVAVNQHGRNFSNYARLTVEGIFVVSNVNFAVMAYRIYLICAAPSNSSAVQYSTT